MKRKFVLDAVHLSDVAAELEGTPAAPRDPLRRQQVSRAGWPRRRPHGGADRAGYGPRRNLTGCLADHQTKPGG